MNRSDADRRRAAVRSLHDNLAQGLNFLNLQVQMLEESLRQGRHQEAAEIVPLLRAGVQECYEDMRALLHRSRAQAEQRDFDAALLTVVREFGVQSGLAASLTAEGSRGSGFSRDEQLQILFIVQEALSNIRKHAHATRVQVTVRHRQDFSLSISDNGVGFDSAAVSAAADKMGLNIMRERARQLNADLAIDSRTGLGTTVQLHIASTRPRAA